MLSAEKLHGDDVPVPVLGAGQREKTKTGRLWTYVRDDRPAGSGEPAAVVVRPTRRIAKESIRPDICPGTMQGHPAKPMATRGFNQLLRDRPHRGGSVLGACQA